MTDYYAAVRAMFCPRLNQKPNTVITKSIMNPIVSQMYKVHTFASYPWSAVYCLQIRNSYLFPENEKKLRCINNLDLLYLRLADGVFPLLRTSQSEFLERISYPAPIADYPANCSLYL